MEFTVSYRDLDTAIKTVSSTVGSGTDITSHIVFRSTQNNDEVECLSHTETVFSSCPMIVINRRGDSSFTVEGKRIKRLLAASSSDDTFSFRFDSEESIVKVNTTKGSHSFMSLNPSSFPFWDSHLAKADVTGTCSAGSLAGLFSYTKGYIADQDRQTPGISVCEMQDGSLKATNRKALSIISHPSLKGCKFRIHGKSVSPLTSFLGNFNSADVDILETDRMVFFRTPEGAVFGENRFTAAFPTLPVDTSAAPAVVVSLDPSDIQQAVEWLQVGADWDDEFLSLNVGDNSVDISLKSASGGYVSSSVPANVVRKSDTLPNRVNVHRDSLLRTLANTKSDNVPLNLIVTKANQGIISIPHEKEGVEYLTVTSWKLA